MAELAAIFLSDPPDVWADLGFHVAGDRARVGPTTYVLGTPGKGVVAATITGLPALDGRTDLDGLPLRPAPSAVPPPVDHADRDPSTGGPSTGGPSTGDRPTQIPPSADQSSGAHPNGTFELDHLVVLTPDLDRTIDAIQAAGLDLRRTRDTGTYGAPMRQAFFKVGATILEVVGGPEATGDGPARFFGLAFTVRDLDATGAFLGDRLRPAKDAVQPGRRIATLDRGAGSKVPMTFMTPEPPR